jgi:hypothetical protein
MQHRKVKLSVAAAGAFGLIATFAATPAFADYAPSSRDFVGVGSDTVQYASDFAADGDYVGDIGYNAGKANKDINFDATPDANARLAYGSLGTGKSNGATPPVLQCSPGTGATSATGQGTGLHNDTPCTLNPTVVLRSGQKPVQRPNGSGAGASAINADSQKFIGYSRASAAQGGKLTSQTFDSITLGKDNLAMIQAASGSHATALSPTQLSAIYKCDDGTGQPVTWNEVGGTGTDAIIPLIPQVGSGTRSTFLADIGGITPGSCVQTVEENDPTAIAAASNPADAIEPMSSGRLNMYQGLVASQTGGSSSPTGVGGYFTDPSCTSASTFAAFAAATNTGGQPTDPCFPGRHFAASGGNPAVTYQTGTPGTGLNTTGSLDKGLYTDLRNLYIYFRDTDVNGTVPAQASGATGDNWVRTLFYDPCPDTTPVAGDGCSPDPVAGEVGPFGTPFFATTTGRNEIAAAGIVPAYVFNHAGP